MIQKMRDGTKVKNIKYRGLSVTFWKLNTPISRWKVSSIWDPKEKREVRVSGDAFGFGSVREAELYMKWSIRRERKA